MKQQIRFFIPSKRSSEVRSKTSLTLVSTDLLIYTYNALNKINE